MILFFGTRTGTPRHQALPGLACPFCGQRGTLQATVLPHFVHLFWIPVFRLRPLRWVVCEHCKKQYEGRDLTPEMQEALEKAAL